jgi:hypothetical protein
MSEKDRETITTQGAEASTGSTGSTSSNEEKKVMVSPLQVVLGALDLATTRGAFRLAELQLITQAYGLLTQRPQTEENASSEQQTKETPIPELERAIQNVVGKN